MYKRQLLVQGVVFAIIYYVVFRAVITKFDLPTPGREKEDLDAEMAAVLANDDYTKVAAIVLEGLGGKGNVAVSYTHLGGYAVRIPFLCLG